ncbi:type VII secretion-associated protein [Mycolicibacterium thermoresistibile]
MSAVILEVGPATVRGPHPVDPETAAAAVEFIDDELALVAERPQPVATLWRQVLAAAAGPDPPALLLICPTWWSRARVQRVSAAAHTTAGVVDVQRRSELLGARLGATDGAVIEIAPDHVAVCAAGTVELMARREEVDTVRAEVLAALGRRPAVLIDAPADVSGAGALAEALADRLRRKRIAVTVAQPDWSERPPAPPRHSAAPGPAPVPRSRRRLRGRSGAVIAGAVAAVCGLVWGVPLPPSAEEPVDTTPMTLLVEGRIAVLVPALWPPRRITTGPGSARLQLVSPTDQQTALHLTQSPVPAHYTSRQLVETLAAALQDQPDGVFTQFDAAGREAGRTAVTYREVRAAHHIDWTVLLDRDVRIAIGCQHPPGRPDGSEAVCAQAVRSAHAIR